MNAHLGLPTSKRDAEGNRISVQNGYGINCNPETGAREQPPGWKSRKDFYEPTYMVYDARVLWDEYHKRFVIAALVHNDHTVAYADPAEKDPTGLLPSSRSANVRTARRALLGIAVSKTDDPRDGWNLSWTHGFPGQEQCPNGKGCVGFATDYLSAAITSKYLVMESIGATVPDQGNAGRVITIVPTAPLAAGENTVSVEPDPSTLGTAPLQPSMQHAPDFDGGRDVFFATPDYNLAGKGSGNAIRISVLEPGSGGTPHLFSQIVGVRTFASTDSVAQPEKGGSIAVERDMVNKLVLRGSSLFLAMDECVLWYSVGCLVTGLRYLRLRLNGVVRKHGAISKLRISVADDETISELKTNAGAAGATWLGFPTLEVDKGGDVVLGYQATSPTIFPQSRYRVQLADDQAFRSSRVMKNGFGTVRASWHHYPGASLDSFDDTGIWIVNGYADASGSWGYAIGKVLGKAVPDLGVAKAFLADRGTKSSYELRIVADNLGDGVAPETRAALTLVRRGSPDVPLKTFRLPSIAPGQRTKTIRVRLKMPAGTVGAGYSLRIELDSENRLEEYDGANNTLLVPAP